MTVVGGPGVVFEEEPDRFDVRRARHAPGLLGVFNHAGVLVAADVHVALRLGAVCGYIDGDADGDVALAAALAVRAPRLGHVCVDLATIRHTAAVDLDVPVDLQALPWPDPQQWCERLRSSPIVAAGEGDHPDRPLRLVGSLLYLDRYWREERQVATELLARAAAPVAATPVAATPVAATPVAATPAGGLDATLARLFPPGDTDGPDLQREAAEVAARSNLVVVAGGPGTGKTTTVARILALLDIQATAAGGRPPLVALAAPTGKAAARLEEAVHTQAATLDVADDTRARLQATSAATLHRLLGSLPRNGSRFRHNRANRLPHDIVVVDETSMVSLSLMSRLVEAVRPDARLILVGDPEQLASVEAGAVLGDIVGDPKQTPIEPGAPPGGGVEPPGSVTAVPGTGTGTATGIGPCVVMLRRVHRYGEAIGRLAEAIRAGDSAAVLAALSAGGDQVTWLPGDPVGGADLAPIREASVSAGRRVTEAARAGDARSALVALGGFRLLCAHRRGPYGVSTWMARVEAWLREAIDDYGDDGPWYAGRPLLVSENDYSLGLYNGDTGVVVATGERRAVAFERRGDVVTYSPTRLGGAETVHAMTVHKSQGSQFDTVAVVLPGPASAILTRELLYTAATRARGRLILAGTDEAITAAVTRPIARASGLRRWLWGEP